MPLAVGARKWLRCLCEEDWAGNTAWAIEAAMSASQQSLNFRSTGRVRWSSPLLSPPSWRLCSTGQRHQVRRTHAGTNAIRSDGPTLGLRFQLGPRPMDFPTTVSSRVAAAQHWSATPSTAHSRGNECNPFRWADTRTPIPARAVSDGIPHYCFLASTAAEHWSATPDNTPRQQLLLNQGCLKCLPRSCTARPLPSRHADSTWRARRMGWSCQLRPHHIG
jgi:hypothetical protein